jgi:hypothetical protein
MKGKTRSKRVRQQAKKPKYLSHEALLGPMHAQATGQDADVLGYSKAVVTVCNCANTSPANLFSTLEQLGVNGVAFQQCVFGSIKTLGYSIAVDSIPDAPSSTLISVVDAITNADPA